MCPYSDTKRLITNEATSRNVLLALGYVGSAALDGEHKPFITKDADGPQHRVTAHPVLLLKSRAGRQRAGLPLASLDPGTEDARQLQVGRLRRAMINRHQIRLDKTSNALTSGYLYSLFIISTLLYAGKHDHRTR